MTHQNHQTNGASLEDCHTNFFALTELYGIKWRKLVWGERNVVGVGCGDGEAGGAPLADPVISSYARCLAGDILCVWRRVAGAYETSGPPPLSLRAAKELWIFWYGEEPDLNGLVAPELIASQGEQGSWESGLSYECRSLLFKALHNLIERCLLSRDFVRLGKWFVQPYDGDEEDVGKSPWHLSFSFAFFLHGESTVCASVDVRQHPPVRTLTPKRRARLHAPDRHPDANVILAPFGLEGRLTGREWSEADAATARLLDAWRHLYPLEQGCAAVEVVCGGSRMPYPVPYVLVTEMEPPAQRPPAHGHMAPRAARALTAPKPHLPAELCYSDPNGDKNEDFLDPTRKTPCTCTKWRRRRAPRAPPFHRRSRVAVRAPPRSSAPPPLGDPPEPSPPSARRCGAGGGSPGSCGAGSPPAGVSAPPSAGAPPPSPSHHAAHPNQAGALVSTTLHTPAPTPDPLAPTTPAPPSLPPPKLYNQGDSPSGSCGAGGGGGGGGGGAPCAGVGGGAGGGAGGGGTCSELYRRPVLPAAPPKLDPLEDEHSLRMLYDYTTVYAWLEHPVKRFKSGEKWMSEELALGAAAGGDLYAGHEHTSLAATPDHRALDIKQEKPDHTEDSKEYKNLFTSDGLCATLKDLDQIFDNSDDAASGDETVRLMQVSTPPDSNKSGCEWAGRCVRAEELSKMFPTPPSMEAHAQPSPGFSLPDEPPPPRSALPLPPPAGSPSPSPDPEPAIEDWSFVFKPPTVCKYVGSSKYAPLTSLPSQLLPPVSLPPHAVYRPRRRRQPPQQRDADTHADSHADAVRNGIKRSSSPMSTECGDGRTRVSCERGVGPGSCARASPAGSVPATPAPPATPIAPPAAPPSHTRTLAACPLLLNVLLADTPLNVFRDHNFDSCTLCVCNADPKVVGNIRGGDAATYLNGACAEGGADAGDTCDGNAAPAEDEPSRCTCGFSAIVNRRRAHRAGLFYEDEIEITGLREEPGGVSGAGGGCAGRLGDVAGVVAGACAAPAPPTASALARAAAAAARRSRPPRDHHPLNLLEYSDGGAAAARALRAASMTSTTSNHNNNNTTALPTSASAVHRWPFIGARAPRSSRDVVRLMRRLRPLLQDAIQKRCCGARMWDGVTGPLTWRQFHRLAGRGNEDLCEPQPVPPLLVGHDRDWVSVSPYALRHWERLALEPYSYARDVAYVVLAADCDALAGPLRAFFRELSAAYEGARLGRHRPLHVVARDGLVRAGPGPGPAPAPASGPDSDEWAGDLPAGRLGEYVRAYAAALRSTLVPQLATLHLDRVLAEADRAERPPPAPPAPAPDPNNPAPPHDPDAEGAVGAGHAVPQPATDEECGAPALVIYVVEPPASHAHRARALHALLRLAANTYDHLHHHNPLVKIISLESVSEVWGGCGEGGGAVDVVGGTAGGGAQVRSLAFSVFSSARRLLQHHANGKSLTGFGTAAHANLFLHSKDEKNRGAYKLFSPAWVLAAPRALNALKEVAETWGQGAGGGESAVLFVSYCLSHDQRWLLAAATDARGELLDTATINIHVPHRSRRRRGGGARRLGLTKLMDFTLAVMSQAAQPWRLVVGRVGRIGHGELKGWSWLLSRKHLDRASNMLREICGSCSVLYPAGVPCILSACLVSTEPDSCLRLMADRFTPDERFSQASIQSHLHTPRDVTATHILVFPTSATTQSNQTPMANGEDTDMMFLNVVEVIDEDMSEDNINDLLIGDMFTNMWAQGSPRRQDDDGPGSPATNPQHVAAHHSQDDGHTEQVGTVLQQPLALGYMVSTAPLGDMPPWWWAGCDHLRDACPAFLKNALHLHSMPAADDFTTFTQRRDHNTHPLDSQTTTDVLRYVLEGYNALSWLALDLGTHDRISCLPLHVQVLMQLYHTAAALG